MPHFKNMLNLKSLYSRFISLVLILTIGATTSAYGSGNPAFFTRKSHAQRYLKKSDNKLSLDFAGKDSLLTINIPQDLGVVVERCKGESDYTVVHIQDSHINPTAQFNIAGLIEEISTKHDTSLMCLEGASTENDTSFYDKFPDDEAKRRVADFFVKRSLFTGAEFYKILHKSQYLKTIGVEDKKAYLEHLFCHRKNQLNREVVLGFFKGLERGLIALKSKVYSKSLKDLSGKSCLYHLTQLKLPKYLKTLEAYSKKAKIDSSKYENLVKMFALIEKEEGVDFQAAAAEREALVLHLSESLPAKELRELSVMSLNFKLNERSDIEFYTYLEQFLHSQPLLVNEEIHTTRYNNLIAYIDYLKFSKFIDYLMVYDEAERLEEEALKALCTNSTQQRLVEYTKAVSILRDLCELKLTSDRLDYMNRNQDYFDIQNITQFMKEACAKYGLPIEDSLLISIDKMFIENIKNFYEIALKRDIAITENTIKSMKDQCKERAILVTGGFHTRGITNILKEKGISYVVICPNIGLIDSERLYLDRLAGRLQNVSELTELFSQTLTAPLITGDASVVEARAVSQEAFEICWNISNNKVLKEELTVKGLAEKERELRISGLLGELASIDSMKEVLPLKWMETISPLDIIEPFKDFKGIELEAEKLLKVKILWHIVCRTLEIEGSPLKPFYELMILDIGEESIAGHSAEFSYYLRLMIEERMGKEIKAEVEKTLEEKNMKTGEGLIEEWDKAVDDLLEEYIDSITLFLKEIEDEFKKQGLFEEIKEAVEHFRERFSYVLIKPSSAGRETKGKKNEAVADFTLRITKEMIQAVVDGCEFKSRKNGKDYEIKTAVEGDLLVIWVKADGQPDELDRDEHSYIELGFEFVENKNKVEILIDREGIKEPGNGILTNILGKVIPHFKEITYVSTNQYPQIIAGTEKTIKNILRKSGREFKAVGNNFGGVFYISEPKPFNPRSKKIDKDSSLPMERREFLKRLLSIPASLIILGADKKEASAQNNIFEDPRDLILNFDQAIDSTLLEKYIFVIEKQGLLEFSSVMQNDYDTTIIVKLGENSVDAEVVAGRLNKALSGKITFAKKFKCVKSSIAWEETKTYKEVENFVDRAASISDAWSMGKLSMDNLGTLLEGVTYVESKYLHWERSFGRIKPIESYTGAIGATQLVKSKAVKHIAELVFKHKDGLIRYSSIILELKRILEEKNPKDNYLFAYFEAVDDLVLQRRAVEKLRRKILANPLLKGVNLYYALSLWLIFVENKKISTTLKIDRKIIEQIADIAQSHGNVWLGEGAYKPKNFHEAECRCQQDLLRAEVIFRVLGEEVIKDIAVKHKTNSGRFEALFNYMKKKVYDDKSYNQKVGYVYLFYLWDRARRLQLKKREQDHVFTEELPKYFESNSRGFDERLAAAAAYNSGWSTVSSALRSFGTEQGKDTIPRWIKNMIGPNRRNPREPINYVRTYLEYTLHYKNALAEKDYNLMCALIEERYNRLQYVSTKKGPRLIEYSKIVTSNGQKQYAKPERSKDDLFNYKLASLLASLLGSDYVDSYIISWGMSGWEDNILSSTAPTFEWMAKRMHNQESGYGKKGEQLLNYFKDNKKQYGKSLAALENSISALTRHKEPRIVLQKKIKAEAKRQKTRGYLVWALKYAAPVFLTGLVSAVLGYIIYRRVKRAKDYKEAAAAKMFKPKKRQVIYKSEALYKSKATGKAYLGDAFVSGKEQKRPPAMKPSSAGESRHKIITEIPIVKQAGKQFFAQASELEKICVSMFNSTYDLQFGYSPFCYGIIIDEAVLGDKEKRIIEFLASQKTSDDKPRFIILINTKDATESIIDKWGLLQKNIMSIDKFLEERDADISELCSEQAKIIKAARLLKNRISQSQPIGIIAGSSVDIEKMAHSIQREKIKGVFISSQQPAATRIDRGGTSIITNFMFEALLVDILLKLKSYNPDRNYTIQELIEILPPIASMEFMEKIELLKAAAEAISQAA